MKDYLQLLLLVFSVGLAWSFLSMFVVCWFNGHGRHVVMVIIAIVVIVFSSIAYVTYEYLITNARDVLVQFGFWYAIGFCSRLLLLCHRRQIFSPVFETDWDELFFSVWVALLGPIETILLVRRVMTERHDPLP